MHLVPANDTGDDDDVAIKHALEYFYPVGHRVWGKVTSAREDERKPGTWRVALDASVVDQATGEDLDPTGAKTRERSSSALSGPRAKGGALCCRLPTAEC